MIYKDENIQSPEVVQNRIKRSFNTTVENKHKPVIIKLINSAKSLPITINLDSVFGAKEVDAEVDCIINMLSVAGWSISKPTVVLIGSIFKINFIIDAPIKN